MLNTKNFQKFASNIAAKNSSFKFANFKKFASNPQVASEVRQGVRDEYAKSFNDNNQWSDFRLDMDRGIMAQVRRLGAYAKGAIMGPTDIQRQRNNTQAQQQQSKPQNNTTNNNASNNKQEEKGWFGKLWDKSKNFVKGVHESGMQEAGNYTKAVVDSDLGSLDQVSRGLSDRAGADAVKAQQIARSYIAQGKPIPKDVADRMAKARAYDSAAGQVMKSTSRTSQDLEKNMRNELERYQSDVEENMYNSRNTQARVSQTLEDKARNDFKNLSGWDKVKVILQRFLSGMGVKIPKEWAYSTFMNRQRNEAQDYIRNKSNLGNQMLGEYAAASQYDLNDPRQRAEFYQINSQRLDQLNNRYKNVQVNPEVSAYIAQQQAKLNPVNSNVQAV
nr:MAG TPA: hypothetical protein [Caudoviricetes sp.]